MMYTFINQLLWRTEELNELNCELPMKTTFLASNSVYKNQTSPPVEIHIHTYLMQQKLREKVEAWEEDSRVTYELIKRR